MNSLKLLVVSLLVLFSTNASADWLLGATIEKTGIDPAIGVFFKTTSDFYTCGDKRHFKVVSTLSDAEKNRILSVLTSAKLAGRQVDFFVVGCDAPSATATITGAVLR